MAQSLSDAVADALGVDRVPSLAQLGFMLTLACNDPPRAVDKWTTKSGWAGPRGFGVNACPAGITTRPSVTGFGANTIVSWPQAPCAASPSGEYGLSDPLATLNAKAQGEATGGRVPQDINVSPEPPLSLPLNRPIGGKTASDIARKLVEALDRMRFTDIRVNQQQLAIKDKLTGLLERVGINRPDIQATTPDGRRVYIEIDTASSNRGPLHQVRIKANDPSAIVILIRLAP